MSPQKKSSQNKQKEAMTEDTVVIEGHKDPNIANDTDTSSYKGIKHSLKWGEIYQVFKDEAYPIPFRLP
jgi:hypothetical protein